MEFKFRAVDDRPLPPSHSPSSSTISYLSEHPLRAGCSSIVPRMSTYLLANPNDAREALQRELEKQQIRREIIAAEIARRRALEEEVRRELMVERELARRKGMTEGLLFEERIAMPFNPRLPLMQPLNNLNLPLEEQIAFPYSSAFKMSPLPQLPQLMVPESEIKPAPETNKDKLIMLAKPDPDLYGSKRKAVTSPTVDGSEPSPFGLKKKPKEEWSCALCQVSATSEKGLNEHLQGKRHRSKEASLRIQKIGKNTSRSFLSKKSEKSVKPTEVIVAITPGLEAKAGELSPQSEVNPKRKTQMMVDKDHSESKKEEQLGQKNQNTEDSKKNGPAAEQAVERETTSKGKKKLKFWCEICQVGTGSQKAMESHEKGRKHNFRIKKFSQNNESILPPTSATVASETAPLTTETDAVNVSDQKTSMKMADTSANLVK